MFTSTDMNSIDDQAPAGAAALMPPTERRVPASSSRQDNARINTATAARIKKMASSSSSEITARIAQLQWEWDVERLSQAVAGGSILATLLLLHFVMGRPLLAALLAGMVAAVLLQHALVGRSLLLPLYRGLGFRTSYEIMDELVACRLLRGDLQPLLLTAHPAATNNIAASPAGPASDHIHTGSLAAAAADTQQQASIRQRKAGLAAPEIEGEDEAGGSAGRSEAEGTAGKSSVWRAELAERLVGNIKESGRLLGPL